MPEPELGSEREITDPLSETTRKERRALLGTTGIAYAVVFGRLVPTSISSLGITLSVGQQSTMLLLIGALIVYFLWMFAAYAWADMTAWEADKRRYKWDYARWAVDAFEQETHGEIDDRDGAERSEAARWERSRRAYGHRKFVEFVIPIVLSSVAIVLCVLASRGWIK